jgi:hypothetical protein
MACYGDRFTSLYVNDVHTSQETYLWTSTTSFGDSFTLLYADDVRTSQETRLQACKACYGVTEMGNRQQAYRPPGHLGG